MEDQTTITSRTEPAPAITPASAKRENGDGGPSHIFQISIRGWIALLITLTFCAAVLLKMPLDDTLKITVATVIGVYFGQNQKKA